MPPPEKTRAELVQRELLRRAFLEDILPATRDTLVDFRRLYELTRAQAKQYRTAQPFPHIVIDDFLPEESLEAVLGAIPQLDEPGVKWGNLNADMPDGRAAQSRKYHLTNVLGMKPALRQLIAELNSGPFTGLLGLLTGIDDLLVDSQLVGGGVHLVKPGGLLRVHADFRRHQTCNLARRLNLLLYMNPDWREEYGGHLELWDREMKHCVERVLPIVNRCVIFATTEDSFHGHPHPLTCPEGMMRRSVALYYYTADPARDVDPGLHATAWQDLPGEKPGG